LNGCGTWSFTLREEHRAEVLKTKVLRRIFRPGRDEATSEWKKLHNEELHDLIASPSICSVTKSRKMRYAGHVACMEERRAAQRAFV
jgi:hypothetical protein